MDSPLSLLAAQSSALWRLAFGDFQPIQSLIDLSVQNHSIHRRALIQDDCRNVGPSELRNEICQTPVSYDKTEKYDILL